MVFGPINPRNSKERSAFTAAWPGSRGNGYELSAFRLARTVNPTAGSGGASPSKRYPPIDRRRRGHGHDQVLDVRRLHHHWRHSNLTAGVVIWVARWLGADEVFARRESRNREVAAWF